MALDASNSNSLEQLALKGLKPISSYKSTHDPLPQNFSFKSVYIYLLTYLQPEKSSVAGDCGRQTAALHAGTPVRGVIGMTS